MKLKVMFVDNNNLKVNRNQNLYNSLLDGRIITEEIFYNNDMFIYSIIMKVDSKAFGITNKQGIDQNESKIGLDKIELLPDYLRKLNMELVKLRFLIIDRKTNTIFYDGNQSDVKTILFNLFDINYNQINMVVSADEFHSLKYMKIKSYAQGQISIYDKKVEAFESELDTLLDLGKINYTSYEIVAIKEGSELKTDKFKEIIETSSDLVQITATGYNKQGHEIKFSSTIAKKIEILPEFSTFDQKRNLDLEQLAKAIKKVLQNEKET